MRTLSLCFALAVCAQAQQFPTLVDKAREALTSGAINATQVDARGDVYFTTNSFLLTTPGVKTIGTGLANGYDDIAVIKMDATLERIVFATLIGGSQFERAIGMKVDTEGNVFLTGFTGSHDFPFSSGGLPESSQYATGFILKLNAKGDSIAYAVPLGERVMGWTLDVDAAGATYIGGQAWTGSLPVTPGAFQSSTARNGNHPFVLKMNPSASKIEFATYVGENEERVLTTSARPDGTVAFLTPSTLGVVSANGSQLNFSVPTGGLSHELGVDGAGNLYINSDRPGYFGYQVDKFSPTGEKIYHTELPAGGQTGGMVVTTDGRVFLTGDYPYPSFPTRNAIETCLANVKAPAGPAGISPEPYTEKALAMLAPDGSVAFATFFRMRLGAWALSPDGRYVYAPGTEPIRYEPLPMTGTYHITFWDGWVRLDLARIPSASHLTPSCLAHGASYSLSAAVPGEIMTIYGAHLGPAAGVSFTLRDGIVPSDLAGTSVTVDGKPAPVLYAQDAQINFIVPWSARTSGSVPVCVTRGGETACLEATSDVVAPFPFWLGSGKALLPDGTVNSPDNRVPRGGYLTLYLTGTGLLDGPLVDGAVSGLPLQRLTATVTATIDGERGPPGCTGIGGGACYFVQLPVEVTYAGAAPTLVSGVTQINLRIPQSVPGGTRNLTITFAPKGLSWPITMQVHIVP